MTASFAKGKSPADCAGNAGLIEARIRRETGRTVSVYLAGPAQLDDEGGTHPYYSICEDHGEGICHTSLALARWHAVKPSGWCSECADEVTG